MDVKKLFFGIIVSVCLMVEAVPIFAQTQIISNLIDKALSEFYAENYSSAVSVFNEVLANEDLLTDVQLMMVYNHLGCSLVAIGEEEEAKNIFIKALKKDPNHNPDLGMCSEKAKKLFEIISKIDLEAPIITNETCDEYKKRKGLIIRAVIRDVNFEGANILVVRQDGGLITIDSLELKDTGEGVIIEGKVPKGLIFSDKIQYCIEAWDTNSNYSRTQIITAGKEGWKWYKSPWVWGIAGVLVAGATVYGLDEAGVISLGGPDPASSKTKVKFPGK